MRKKNNIEPKKDASPKKRKSKKECEDSVLNKRVSIAADMQLRSPKEAGALGCFPFLLAMVTMPHSLPVCADGKTEAREYCRQNGNLHLGIQAGLSSMPGTGVPYGMIPRFIMLRLATLAKMRKSPTIQLGKSMTDFLDILGLNNDGNTYNSVADQFFRLVTSNFLSWEGPGIHSDGISFSQLYWVDDAFLWWKPIKKQGFISSVTLSDLAYKEMTEHVIPVDLRGLEDPLIKKSPLAFDLYVWIPCRAKSAEKSGKEARIPWVGLLEQLGAGYSREGRGMSNFKIKCRMYIDVIRKYYPGITIDDSRPDYIIIK